MTFAKIAYVSTKNLDGIVDDLNECGFENAHSEHIDSAGEPELWVDLSDDYTYILDAIQNYGYISVDERESIESGHADTVLFY